MKLWLGLLAVASVAGLVWLVVDHYEDKLDDLEDAHSRELDYAVDTFDIAMQGVCHVAVYSKSSLIFSDRINYTDAAIEKDPRGRLEPPPGVEQGLMIRCLPIYLGRQEAVRIRRELERRIDRLVAGIRGKVGTDRLNTLTMEAYRFLYDEYRAAASKERTNLARRLVIWLRWYREIQPQLW
jgi:hypothetical protein